MVQTAALISIIIFAVILIIIGYYFRHKRISEEFFMAGRKAGVLRIVASIFTLLGAGEIVTLTAFAYIYGFSGISLFFGILAGALFAGLVMPKIRNKNKEYKPYTITDYFRKFLGVKAEKISIVLQLVAIGSLLLIQLVVGGLLISTLTGLSYALSVIIVGAIIAIYLSWGGFHSVLVTDIIQMMGMLLLLFFLLILYNPPGSELANLISLSGTIIPPVDFIVLFIAGFFAVFSGADVYQRIFAANSDKTARKGINITGGVFLVFGLLMILFGLKIFSQFPLADPNNAFFVFLESDLSTVFISLLSIFILASVFSSADTELFLSSILLGKLLYGKKVLSYRIGQVLVWLIIIVATLLAINFTALVDIYFILLFAFMITGPVMLARVFGRGNDNIAFIGMLISLVLLLVLGYLDLLGGLYPLLLIIPPSLSFFFPANKL